MDSIVDPPTDSKPSGDEDDSNWSEVTVEIPPGATPEDVERIFVAVADAAYDAQPEDRNWDIFVHGHGPRPAGGIS